MYEFLLNMWIINHITEEDLQLMLDQERITQREYDVLLQTPQAK